MNIEHSTTPIIVPYDIPLKNTQDMAYGTSEITTYGIFKMTYGVILAWLNVRYWVFVFSFDVGRSMFDVRRLSFKTTPYGINATCERLQYNLALMPEPPTSSIHALCTDYP